MIVVDLASPVMLATPQRASVKGKRNNVGDVLRRAEAGEHITITVSGRPVAELGPVRSRRWVDTASLGDLWDLPPDPQLAQDVQAFDAGLRDPWAD